MLDSILFIFNAPESKVEDLSTQKKDDVSFVNELCERLGIPLVEIINVSHLSSKSSSKNCLLRVKCCDLKQRQQLLESCVSMRNLKCIHESRSYLSGESGP